MKLNRPLTLAVSVLSLSLAAAAQDLKTADDVIKFSTEKADTYKTWSADTVQTVSMFQGQMRSTGRVTFKAPELMRMETETPVMGQESAKMSIVLGADGVMWIEVAMAGGKQVMKTDMSQIRSNATAATGLKMDKLTTTNPAKGWVADDYMDYVLVKSDTLQGQPMHVLDATWKQAVLTNQQIAAQARMTPKMRIYIGQKDGFLHKMETVDSTLTNVVSSMEYSNLKFNEDIPDSLFTYEPPPDVPVTEMKQTMGGSAASGKAPAAAPPAPASTAPAPTVLAPALPEDK